MKNKGKNRQLKFINDMLRKALNLRPKDTKRFIEENYSFSLICEFKVVNKQVVGTKIVKLRK